MSNSTQVTKEHVVAILEKFSVGEDCGKISRYAETWLDVGATVEEIEQWCQSGIVNPHFVKSYKSRGLDVFTALVELTEIKQKLKNIGPKSYDNWGLETTAQYWLSLFDAKTVYEYLDCGLWDVELAARCDALTKIVFGHAATPKDIYFLAQKLMTFGQKYPTPKSLLDAVSSKKENQLLFIELLIVIGQL